MADYDRFWELHITGTNGHYDFAPSIRDQVNHHLEAHDDKLTAKRLLVTPKDHRGPGIISRVANGDKGLPPTGYVATCISVIDMATPTNTVDDRALVAWINDPAHVGKLRINAHGNGMGQVGMADGMGSDYKVFYQNADAVVTWLVANGLAAVTTARADSLAGKKNTNGLITVNLAVCMGARSGTTPAELNWGATNTKPADGSAADKVARALAKAGLKGVEVTASNEITMDGANGKSGQWGRTFGLGGGQAPFVFRKSGRVDAWDISPTDDMSGAVITVPDGWHVSPNILSWGATISPPADFDEYIAQGATPSAGWHIKNKQGDRIEIPGGWLVDQPKKIIQAPLGFVAKSNGKFRGGTLSSIPDASPFVGMGQRLAHSATKARVIS